MLVARGDQKGGLKAFRELSVFEGGRASSYLVCLRLSTCIVRRRVSIEIDKKGQAILLCFLW